MILTSGNRHHPWWVFPTALAFGLGLATVMGAPIGRQVSKTFSLCDQQKNKSHYK
ncbi:hypothetical protein Desca_0436 [Desulfotomaculum nigrificans CO-1-SRB]|uniref:Uncharacterized protein n=1 Tax=Desulfotomaculum nigrificans (strain DSM 14880 / VKM B-2319 / CO-1-SRB) TaxID=868595 RepID=F6B704_DESCC|nr:hypothetical protein [Desulfotomaculum nigrificans]AEF93329.1 hypothetical protein Desca_0436 [Desulfotomaculum nigrificans CO-1-SRB]